MIRLAHSAANFLGQNSEEATGKTFNAIEGSRPIRNG
jgi:hypothetical protein